MTVDIPTLTRRITVVPNRRNLFGMQLARAAAAILVVSFHIGRMLYFKTGLDTSVVTQTGAAGVDVFFVISGFIMFYTTQAGLSPKRFLLLRLIRIAPLYWVLTLLLLAVTLASPQLTGHTRFSVTNAVCSILFIPSTNDKGQINPVLDQGWTLAYEAMFYLVLAIASRILFRKRLAILWFVFAASTVAGTTLPFRNAAFTTYTDPVVFEFLFGGVLAWLHQRQWLAVSKWMSVGMIAAGSVALFAGTSLAGIGLPRPIYWGLPATLIILGILNSERWFDYRRMWFAQQVGDSSYSLYLWHSVVLSVVGTAFRFPLARMAGGVPIAILSLVPCLLTGWFSFRCIEAPMTRYCRAFARVDPDRQLGST